MKKKNKEVENDNLQEEKVEMENYWDVFLRNYRNVPAFKSLVKLIIYILLILLFVLVASSANHSNESMETNNKTTSTTTITQASISYQNLLDDIINKNKKINIEVLNNSERYIIDSEIDKGIMNGYYTTNITTKRFCIENNKVYELNLDEKILNDELFANVDINFINQHYLIGIIKNNIGTKELVDGEIIYNYEITSNEKKYNLKSYIKDNILYRIDVEGENIKYNISYK